MNASNLCRTCLILMKKEKVGITKKMFEFLQNIMQLNELPRKHDTVKLPQFLCLNCFKQLLLIKRFQVQCKDSEQHLILGLENTLKLQNVAMALDNMGSTTSTNTMQYDFDIQSELLEDNSLQYETTEMLNIEELEKEFEAEVEVIDGEAALHPPDEKNNMSTDNAATIECVDDFEDIIKLENEVEVECIEDVIDSSEVVNVEIESEQVEAPEEIIDLDSLPSFEDITHTITNQNSQRNFKCPDCDKSFQHKSALTTHNYIHSNSRPYICEVCGNTFRQRSTLATHMAIHKGKTIDCELCGKKFARKSQLILHYRMHRNEKPFECDYPDCGAAFRQNQYLRAHKETHSGVRRYQCTICTGTYFNRILLMGHMHRVHGSLFYQCDMCERSFKKPQPMRNHLLSVHQVELVDVSHLKRRKTNNSTQPRN